MVGFGARGYETLYLFTQLYNIITTIPSKNTRITTLNVITSQLIIGLVTVETTKKIKTSDTTNSNKLNTTQSCQISPQQ